MKEVWRDVIGYEGKYKVSSRGRVGKIRVHNNYKENPLKINSGGFDKDRYLRTSLRKDGKRSYVRIHRLVAEAFIPNFKNDPIVNHKDGNKSNNVVENLEWSSYQYNVLHSFQELGRKGFNGGTNKRVIQMNPDTLEEIKIFESIKEASIAIGQKSYVGIPNSMKRVNGTCGGFVWKFASEGVETIENASV